MKEGIKGKHLRRAGGSISSASGGLRKGSIIKILTGKLLAAKRVRLAIEGTSSEGERTRKKVY